MKKQTVKSIIIAAAVVLVIALIILAIFVFRTDGFGHNMIQRNKVIARVNGDAVRLGEFSISYSNQHYNIEYYSMLYAMYGMDVDLGYDTTSDTWEDELKEDVLTGLICQHLYVQEAENLGLEPTDDKMAEVKASGNKAIESLSSSYRSQLEENGYSGDALEQALNKQLSNYFLEMGFTKSAYKKLIVWENYASACQTLVTDYYEAQCVVTDEQLMAEYDSVIQDYYIDGYTEGAYSTALDSYLSGTSSYPWLYIPEDSIFVRIAAIDCPDAIDAAERAAEVTTDEEFEAMVQSADNLESYFIDNKILGEDEGVAISEKDSMFSSEVYETANALEVGQFGSVVVTADSKDDDGNAIITYTLYFVKRVEGETGVVPYETYADTVGAEITKSLKSKYFTDIVAGWLKSDAVEHVSDAYMDVESAN